MTIGAPARHGQLRRILFVLEYFYPHIGGVETLFLQLAEALAAAGHQVTVVTSQLPGTPRRELRQGVEIVRVPTPRFAARYFFMALSLPTVLRLARSMDLIHTTTYNAALPAWLASLVTRKPSVITVHEVFGSQWNNLPGLNRWVGYGFRVFEWLVLHLPFTHYLCVSEFTRGRLVSLMNVSLGRTSLAYPAIDHVFWQRERHQPRDIKVLLALPPDTFVYLFFGRPGISKGLEYLIDAVPSVSAALPQSRLVLLTPPDPRGPYERLLRQIDRLGVSDRVIVHPPVPRIELPGWLLGAGCVVVPSISEGFGYSAAEAALLGCPVVATRGHAVEEVVGEAVTLVPSRDPQALADAVIRIARHRPPQQLPSRRYDVAGHIEAVCRAYALLGGAVPVETPAPQLLSKVRAEPGQTRRHGE